MRKLTILAPALSAALLAPAARAVGVGIMGNAGLHEARAYYYKGDEQGIDVQHRPNVGFGAEALLGDRDDKVLGLMRFYWMSDSPLLEPDIPGDKSEYVWPREEDEPAKDIGVMTIGAQWGVWGDPTGFQVVLTSLAGSGFATADNLEFLVLEPGAGVTWTWEERVQVFADLAYTLRLRKRLYHGQNAYAGVRYMFD